MDIWQYIKLEDIELPSLYFSHVRPCFERNGVIMAVTDFIELLPEEAASVKDMRVRFRTIGDATCTGAALSDAADLDAIIGEVAAARQTERGTRADDKRSETAMEDRKKEGYF
jgi:sulfate adenylyltransferase subunit 2